MENQSEKIETPYRKLGTYALKVNIKHLVTGPEGNS